ncbi:anthranilate synthase component I family protein [Flavihumibacter profundi]|uniref:anthranilate synthase component I family protein n=1 Tax=Flavihumibacter profundi TaxID=2716883 RepID=UPI001CC36335|nr:anthranilate synthase component I family protein [Flavihumibacter profundi]MBZ5856639.1 anthranilate synthase component I family protein [Flavihumibacter profundi]
MKKIRIETEVKQMLADVHTPVGIYLRLRDRFRDTILLESTDHHAADNSYSFIGINAIAGMEISTTNSIEYKFPAQAPEKAAINDLAEVPAQLWGFMQRFELIPPAHKAARFAQGLYGYTTYDAVQFFDSIKFAPEKSLVIPLSPSARTGNDSAIPLMRYRLYQYVIAINHFKDELYLCENKISGVESELPVVESLIRNRDVPVFPFRLVGEEETNMPDETYMDMVRKGIASCLRGDVFQIVLSRRFRQGFHGDEFNVYRALRTINPSPYLFFFDYGDYKLMGSSPEAQLIINNGKAVVHPIAGTYKRSGDETIDQQETQRLLLDAKENAEHVMLVDLARNDLSRLCNEVEVTHYRQVQYFSHVIHLVSEVTGKVTPGTNPFLLMAKTFPAGTLSGAPKIRAMQLIDKFEPTARSYYGGAIGFIGFDGTCNHAIMIRTFLSRQNTLTYQAGAGVVAASNPASELAEVNNKLRALKKALELAKVI